MIACDLIENKEYKNIYLESSYIPTIFPLFTTNRGVAGATVTTTLVHKFAGVEGVMENTATGTDTEIDFGSFTSIGGGGDVIEINGERIKIVSKSGSKLSVVRGFNGTVAGALAVGDKFKIVTNVSLNACSTMCSGGEKAETVLNTYQMMHDCVKLTQAQKQSSGSAYGNRSPLHLLRRQKINNIMRKIDSTLLYGINNANISCEDEERTTGGIKWYIDNHNGFVVDASDFGTLKLAMTDITTKLNLAGSTITHAIMNVNTKQCFVSQVGCTTVCNPAIQGSENATAGVNYTQFVDPVLGKTIIIRESNVAKDGEIYFVNRNDLEIDIALDVDNNDAMFLKVLSSKDNSCDVEDIYTKVMVTITEPSKIGYITNFTCA